MAYFLKKSNTKKGVYLQIYESYRNKEKKETSHRAVKSIGYVSELTSEKIPDPIAHYQAEVRKMNEERKREMEASRIKTIEGDPTKNLGYFLVKSVFGTLKIESHLNLLAKIAGKAYDLNEAITSLVSARIVSPCSKIKTMEEVIPSFLEPVHFSNDQLYDSILPLIGDEYERILEIINHAFAKKYGRKTESVFFDGTNYYFEIDREKGDRRKGPSKENRNDPIISMGLLLDAEQIPLSMRMFPGNESEKPVLREIIRDMKEKNNISGKTIQVADKGLNCARNICEALKNGDGYIFSQSVKRLPEQEKKWALLENENARWAEIRDDSGALLYKYKFCIDSFPYKVADGNNRQTTVNLAQKRVVTFSPLLAEKKSYEIRKMVEKAKELNGCRAKRKEYGDAARYVSFKAVSDDGEILDDTVVTATINQKKGERGPKACGVQSAHHLGNQDEGGGDIQGLPSPLENRGDVQDFEIRIGRQAGLPAEAGFYIRAFSDLLSLGFRVEGAPNQGIQRRDTHERNHLIREKPEGIEKRGIIHQSRVKRQN